MLKNGGVKMLGLNTRLAKLEEEGKQIKVGLVGAGQMGKRDGQPNYVDERYDSFSCSRHKFG